jgi:serine phosphatase RsbU (regulator of sigma subunit)/FixJ family two-component response regulator
MPSVFRFLQPKIFDLKSAIEGGTMQALTYDLMTTKLPTPPRTLIADDQLDVLEALRLLLKSEGYQIEVVTSPVAILEALKSHEFDLLLMDLNYARDTTSGREGLDLLSDIRAMDDTLPIVVMTAWGSIDLAVEAMHRGVGDFVQKPWENSRLLTILRAQIEQGRGRRRAQRLEAAKKALTREVPEAVDLQTLFSLVTERLQEALWSPAVTIFMKAAHEQVWEVAAHLGMSDEDAARVKFEPGSRLLGMMDGPFDVRKRKLPPGEELKLKKVDGTFVVPVRFHGELVAFITLAEKWFGGGYDRQDAEFLTAIAEQLASAIKTSQLRQQEQEFEAAREMQQGFLPKEIPHIHGYEITGAWQPAGVVSGDSYDVLKLGETTMALCIADVVGKGMPAALLMSNLQAAVKSLASETLPPQEFCAKVNQIISHNIAPGKFITFFYCLLDGATKRLVYTNAGHNAPILLRRDGSLVRLQEGGTALGLFDDWTYLQDEAELASGDRLVLFTDGVTEVRNSDGEEFGERRLINLLVENRELSAARLQQEILNAVTEFSGGDFQDDATLIVMAVE